MTEELKQYIKESIQKGVKKNDLIKSLISVGWDEDKIKETINFVILNQGKENQNKKTNQKLTIKYFLDNTNLDKRIIVAMVSIFIFGLISLIFGISKEPETVKVFREDAIVIINSNASDISSSSAYLSGHIIYFGEEVFSTYYFYYKEEDQTEWNKVAEKSTVLDGSRFSMIEIKNLKPETIYQYKMVLEQGILMLETETKTFITER